MTGNVYCVDLSNGYVYRIVTDENGNEVLDGIQVQIYIDFFRQKR